MMWRAAGSCVLLIFVSLVGALAQAAVDPVDALAQMSMSLRERNYQGLFTYEHGQKLSSLRITHAVIDGQEHERLVRLDGQELSFSRHVHGPDCVHPGAVLLRSGYANQSVRLEELYQVQEIGRERIAGHQGVVFQLLPRDRYRYGRLLVLEAETALLLKSEIRDPVGRVIERFQFVELELDSAAPVGEPTDTSIDIAGIHTHRDLSDTTPLPVFDWQVGWVPNGFTVAGRQAASTNDPQATADSEIYSDGLAVFTVFVEEASDARIREAGVATQGATIAYTALRNDNRLVTVIGEVPVETAQLVASSVNFSPAQP